MIGIVMEKAWLQKRDNFVEMDVRGLRGNFLPAILKKAGNLKAGEGIKVVQSFEPIPLYSTMEEMGFEHVTEKCWRRLEHVVNPPV